MTAKEEQAVQDLRDELQFISRAEIGDILEFSHQRVSQLVQEGVIPQDAHSRHPRKESMHAVVRWLLDRIGEGKTAAP